MTLRVLSSERELFRRALAVWGLQKQVAKAMEEACELGGALNGWLEGRKDLQALATEIADVLIMIGQSYTWHPEIEELVAVEKTRKLFRLNDRVTRAELRVAGITPPQAESTCGCGEIRRFGGITTPDRINVFAHDTGGERCA